MVLFFALLMANAGFATPLDKFHVCTMATFEHHNLGKLRQSCHKHKINLEVIGLNRPFYHNGTKLAYFKEYIENFRDDEVVLFVDAFDVLIVADKEVILQKFKAMRTPFVMSAELNCGPHPDLAPLYPESPTPFKYINTGSYIGYVRHVKEWLNHLNIDVHKCDQGQATIDFLNTAAEQRRFVLDYQCELFLPLIEVPDDWVLIDTENNVVFNTLTQTAPSVIHANGISFRIWDRIYDALIKPRKKKREKSRNYRGDINSSFRTL